MKYNVNVCLVKGGSKVSGRSLKANGSFYCCHGKILVEISPLIHCVARLILTLVGTLIPWARSELGRKIKSLTDVAKGLPKPLLRRSFLTNRNCTRALACSTSFI